MSSPSAGSGASSLPSLFSESLRFLPGMLKDQDSVDQESFAAEEVDVVRDVGSGYTTTVDLETRLEAFFFWRTSGLWGLFSSSAEVSGFPEFSFRIKGILL